MKTFEEMSYHPIAEQLTQILCEKSQNPNPLFFRVLVAYYFNVMASMMRVSVATHDRGEIPINMYALNLGTSGSGKGLSTNIMENQVIHKFRHNFLENTFPRLAEDNLPKLSLKRATRKGTDPDEEIVRTQKEFDELGSLVFSFDSGTSAAVKQLRHKLLMAESGSMCLQMDEIGTNLLSNTEVLGTFLELYDVGRIKSKLLKNTTDNKRNEEIVGVTPTNMLLFGTPAKLLDGSKVEEELYSMLETGYARRCFFGYSRTLNKDQDMTPEQVYALMTNRTSNEFLEQISHQFEQLADITYANKKLVMTKDVALLLIEYKMQCERIANALPEHAAIRAAEISHRYFKVLKLAGAYAFVDDSPELLEDHVYAAIKLAEESGEAFNRLLTRDRNYIKLAKYISAEKRELTQADLAEDLPFYRGHAGAKTEMMNLAIAWGYKNNIIIKKSFSDGIEFFRGESLVETNLDKLVLSYGTDIAQNFQNEYAPWDKLFRLTQAQGLHWVSHHLVGGHRIEENAIPGFNLIVIDVDGGTPMSVAKELLAKYKYLMYTTKRHQTPEGNNEDRYRIIFPMNYTLKMDAADFKEFMKNIYSWFPFEIDEAVNQRARKWLSHDGYYEYNEGEMFDALPFIPKTSKNEERKRLLNDQQSMDNMERWFLNNTGDGNRNNMLLRYGTVLVDSGMPIDQINAKVIELNNKMADKLEEAEIYSTILVTVAKRYATKP